MNEELRNELQTLIMNMDIPLTKRLDVRWLGRNLAIRNSQHANFKRAREIIVLLIKELDKQENG